MNGIFKRISRHPVASISAIAGSISQLFWKPHKTWPGYLEMTSWKLILTSHIYRLPELQKYPRKSFFFFFSNYVSYKLLGVLIDYVTGHMLTIHRGPDDAAHEWWRKEILWTAKAFSDRYFNGANFTKKVTACTFPLKKKRCGIFGDDGIMRCI